LGGGVDVCYPRENIDLYTALKEQGVVVSERPLGRQAMPYDFPIRNRIISGLSLGVLVVEAGEGSGSGSFPRGAAGIEHEKNRADIAFLRKLGYNLLRF
jgi:predicted Rossmann fold nucleotide-binding protein DprA/Smf involved in DNA uptake